MVLFIQDSKFEYKKDKRNNCSLRLHKIINQCIYSQMYMTFLVIIIINMVWSRKNVHINSKIYKIWLYITNILKEDGRVYKLQLNDYNFTGLESKLQTWKLLCLWRTIWSANNNSMLTEYMLVTISYCFRLGLIPNFSKL